MAKKRIVEVMVKEGNPKPMNVEVMVKEKQHPIKKNIYEVYVK